MPLTGISRRGGSTWIVTLWSLALPPFFVGSNSGLADKLQLKLGPGSDSSGLRLIAFVSRTPAGPRARGRFDGGQYTVSTSIRNDPPSLPVRLSNSVAVR